MIFLSEMIFLGSAKTLDTSPISLGITLIFLGFLEIFKCESNKLFIDLIDRGLFYSFQVMWPYSLQFSCHVTICSLTKIQET